MDVTVTPYAFGPAHSSRSNDSFQSTVTENPTMRSARDFALAQTELLAVGIHNPFLSAQQHRSRNARPPSGAMSAAVMERLPMRFLQFPELK